MPMPSRSGENKEEGLISFMRSSGQFIISLDYELYWGLRDLYPLSYYRDRYPGERDTVMWLLKMFEQYQIHATWAVVGLMFCESLDEIKASLPDELPGYTDPNISPYPYIEKGGFGHNEREDADHYALTVIKAIQETRHQRVSTHTFSHYYCKEEGQTIEQFRADLEAALRVAERKGIKIESIVFPRNQFNESYLGVLKELGIRSYRGNPRHSLYSKGYSTRDSVFLKALRLLDSYVNYSGHHCFSAEEMEPGCPANVPASLFLRPYYGRLRLFERLRLRRILSGMTHAAKRGLVYHLWWHPYNLSSDPEENRAFLGRILDHFKILQAKYGMQSVNMEELAESVLQRRSKGSGSPAGSTLPASGNDGYHKPIEAADIA